MHVYTYSDARNNLKLVLDKVVEDAEVAFITRKDGGHAVIMGQDHYDSLMETLYLLSSPNNANRLNESIAQLRASQTIERELIEDEK
ncbi:type II toxin-antitoxin system prevent-host-death family antitoxin [Ignatzschineria larvae DSM 13226]|uniref:Antitoxin n=1 Tax=Ignatzschineria larvae DSM 13226 TaxID=1111732 RepID=A0ABZ3C120_9GAMM|nr:type II toxin-antitoxin system prevent-host-death family antitoxin [Ignatzschineria larvae]